MSAKPLSMWVAVVAGLVASAAGPASAGQFQVSPTRVQIPAGKSSQTLAVRNVGGEPVRFHITAFAWHQEPDGSTTLEPTEDIIVFPTLFSIDGGGTRHVRIGSRVRAGAIEKTYRILVSELPPPASERSVGVKVLARMSIPIFIEPGSSRRKLSIQAGPGATGMRVAVHNRGNSHLMLSELAVEGLDDSGEAVFESKHNGWYLLGGGVREFAVALPADVCAKLARVALSVRTSRGSKRELVTSDEVCGGR